MSDVMIVGPAGELVSVDDATVEALIQDDRIVAMVIQNRNGEWLFGVLSNDVRTWLTRSGTKQAALAAVYKMAAAVEREFGLNPLRSAGIARLTQLIGRVPTRCPTDKDEMDNFIKFLTEAAAKIGTTLADVYRKVELTCMSEDQVAELDPDEREQAMMARKAAREVGLIK